MRERELLIAMAKAHDAEQSAHMGEPSPWSDDDLDPEWIDERVTCMQLALEVYRREGERELVEALEELRQEAEWLFRRVEAGDINPGKPYATEAAKKADALLAKHKEQQPAEAPPFPHKACGTYDECRREGICLDGWRCIAEHKEQQP